LPTGQTGAILVTWSSADPCVALFMAAHSAMPMQPAVSLPLTLPDLGSRPAAARRIGYRVI
jgi:hypothetical protein